MSETPEVDSEAMDGICCYGDPLKSWGYKRSKDGEVVPADFARRLERERDEARRELDGIISCIEQAIDFHQVHHQSYEAAAIRNLLENINQRRTKYENREL